MYIEDRDNTACAGSLSVWSVAWTDGNEHTNGSVLAGDENPTRTAFISSASTWRTRGDEGRGCETASSESGEGGRERRTATPISRRGGVRVRGENLYFFTIPFAHDADVKPEHLETNVWGVPGRVRN